MTVPEFKNGGPGKNSMTVPEKGRVLTTALPCNTSGPVTEVATEGGPKGTVEKPKLIVPVRGHPVTLPLIDPLMGPLIAVDGVG